MIEEKYKFISIDIPRTGTRARLFASMPESSYSGKLVQEKYWKKIGKHARSIEYLKKDPIKYFKYFKYTFIRNPWARMVSFYHYRKKGDRNLDFDDYIINDLYKDLCIQQIDYISIKRKFIIVDFIGRYENLYNDFDFVCTKIKFDERLAFHPEKINSKEYMKYYSEKTKNIIYKKFEKDISLFNYEFGQ